jgi:hypothetical protein
MTYNFEIESVSKKKDKLSKFYLIYLFLNPNYAATAGATKATGKDSPAAKSRGKL